MSYGYDAFGQVVPQDPAYAAAGYGATYGAAYGAYPMPMGGEEVRTIFITGFPEDVKERELNNLLRFLPGYIASQMNWKNGQAQGFALFDSGHLAKGACDRIASVQFDEVHALRCELARKNMYIKEDPTLKKPRFNGGFTAPPPAFPGAAAPYAGAVAGPVQPAGFAPVTNANDNPPCSTLFVGNLGDNISEAELRGVFGNQPGFMQMKLSRGMKGVTCFVEFQTVESAMGVHDTLQGAMLTSSDRGGIRIQYSKNPFGKRKEPGM